MLCIVLPGVCIGEAIDFWTPKGICATPTDPWTWDGVYMACAPPSNVCVRTGTVAGCASPKDACPGTGVIIGFDGAKGISEWVGADMVCIAPPGFCVRVAMEIWAPKGIYNCAGEGIDWPASVVPCIWLAKRLRATLETWACPMTLVVGCWGWA